MMVTVVQFAFLFLIHNVVDCIIVKLTLLRQLFLSEWLVKEMVRSGKHPLLLKKSCCCFFVQIGQFYRRVKRDFFSRHHSEQFRDKVRQAYKTLDLIATFA